MTTPTARTVARGAPSRRLARHRAIVVVLLLVLAGCGGSGAPATERVPANVVPERAAAWTAIRVTAAGGPTADVPAALKPKAAPLLTARLLASPEPLTSYGLDAPVATIVYEGATRTRTVAVGDANFDGHGYYVQRQGDRRVFLVPADQLRPILALVGLA
jgi:uncharacterized protein DUF4340